jgi:hypothetical protein
MCVSPSTVQCNSLLLANLALAAGKDHVSFSIPIARRALVCQFELPSGAEPPLRLADLRLDRR